MERKPDGKVRDHVRLARATDRDKAFELAKVMVADEFTTWVFEVGSQAGKDSYVLLKVLKAARRSRR